MYTTNVIFPFDMSTKKRAIFRLKRIFILQPQCSRAQVKQQAPIQRSSLNLQVKVGTIFYLCI